MPSWRKKANRIIALGMNYLGTPYEFGAAPGSTGTFDCSSFTQYIYGRHGIRLPRISRQQCKKGRKVSLSRVRRGDLLFFATRKRQHRKGLQKIGHVAVCLGRDLMLHASEEKGISILNMHEYPKGVLARARRVIR
ncbi:MAG: C40 family peptidase [Clostridia bacterium]